MTVNQPTRQHQEIPDEWRGILASARKAKLTKVGAATVAEILQGFGTDARSLIKAALDDKDGHAATVLMVGSTLKVQEHKSMNPLATYIFFERPEPGRRLGTNL
jgi:hypothetical protein